MKIKNLLPLIIINVITLLLMLIYLLLRYYFHLETRKDNSYLIIFFLSITFLLGSFYLYRDRKEFSLFDQVEDIVKDNGHFDKFSSLIFGILSYLGGILGLILVLFKVLNDFSWFRF